MLGVALGAILFLQLVLLVLVLQLAGRLRRLQAWLVEKLSPPAPAGVRERSSERRARKRLFEQYLDEDPNRRYLPKKEQFSGFRRWRSEQGLNWGSEDP